MGYAHFLFLGVGGDHAQRGFIYFSSFIALAWLLEYDLELRARIGTMCNKDLEALLFMEIGHSLRGLRSATESIASAIAPQLPLSYCLFC